MKRVLLFIFSVLLLTAIISTAVILIMRANDRAAYDAELAAYPIGYVSHVLEASRTYGVPPDVILSVIRTESGFEADIKSHAGAIGLMQIMPVSCEWIAFLRGEECDPEKLTDPAFNIDCGVFMLGWLYRHYENWDTVFAAYNAGYARVNGWLEDKTVSQDGKLANIPIAETEAYVKAVNSARSHYDALYEFGETITPKPYSY